MAWREEKSCFYRHSNSHLSVVSPYAVAIPTALSRFHVYMYNMWKCIMYLYVRYLRRLVAHGSVVVKALL
jgi:hypothetical protein